MPLFLVQDSDRPLWIVAKDYGEAESIWTDFVAKENDMKVQDVEPPQGISFICEDNDLILTFNLEMTCDPLD